MQVKNIFKGGVSLTLALLLALTACSTVNDKIEETEQITEVIKQTDENETNTFSLIGTWDSSNVWGSAEHKDGSSYEAVITDDDEIIIYQYVNDECFLYWDGTFESRPKEQETININSERNTDIDSLRTDDTVYFTYHDNDGTIYFSHIDDEGTSIGVYLSRTSNDYYINYNFANIQDDNTETANLDDITDKENTDITEDTVNTENVTQGEETAQNDESDSNITNNSADNITAENNTNNADKTADKGNDNTDTNNADNTPTYTYTDKSETMYSTIGLNVRSGPWTSFNIIGSYSYGDMVNITGTCNETGWSRVNYNGQTGYCDTSYLTNTEPVIETVTSNNNTNNTNNTNDTSANSSTAQTQTETYVSGGFPLYNYGYINGQYLGRVRIPSVGVNVAIYNSMAQSVCDAYDSACFAYSWDPPEYGNYTIVLADHSNQGFNAIKNCSIGTALYVDGVNGNTYKYVCDRIDYNGRNDLTFLYDSVGNCLDKTGGLWAYTCNQDWQHVTVVHFSPV